MKAFLILVVIAFGLRTCPSKRSDESSPYKAIRCGLNRKDELKETFIFHKGNGHLFYFDLDKENFYPINRRVKQETINAQHHKQQYLHRQDQSP